MLKSKHKWLILVVVVAASAVAYVTTKKIIATGNAKEYTLNNVALVVSNSDKCNAILQSFSELESRPIKLQFATNKDQQSQFTVAHSEETLKNHSHSIAKQKVGDTVYRVGTGEFEFKGEKVDYVIVTSTDIKNPHYNHNYPLIISADEARCHFTALLKPSAETIKSFIENVKSGSVAKQLDLSVQ